MSIKFYNMKRLTDLILDLLNHLNPQTSQDHDGLMWMRRPENESENTSSPSKPDALLEKRAERIRDQFREKFWIRSLKYLFSLATIVLVVISFQEAIIGEVKIQTIGITTSIFGSIVLGRSLLRGPHSVIRETSAKTPTQDGSNMDPITIEYVSDTIDGISGICYLVLGFILQLGAITI